MKPRSAMGAGLGADGYGPASNDDCYFGPKHEILSEVVWPDPKLRVVNPADISEVMSSVEDLWLRLVRHAAVHAAVSRDVSTGASLVMFRFDGNGRDDDHAKDDECCQLLLVAASRESYLWSQGGHRGTLVSDLQWLGNTLVIELASSDQMRRWPEGDALEWSMQALLQRVKAQGGRP